MDIMILLPGSEVVSGSNVRALSPAHEFAGGPPSQPLFASEFSPPESHCFRNYFIPHPIINRPPSGDPQILDYVLFIYPLKAAAVVVAKQKHGYRFSLSSFCFGIRGCCRYQYGGSSLCRRDGIARPDI